VDSPEQLASASVGIADLHPHFYFWFIVFVLACLSVDLFALRKSHGEVSVKSATIWSMFWIGLALAFNGWVYFSFGSQAALTFLTGYVVELSLSVDNLFVFILIFGAMRIPPQFQHRVLFWGILGALVMRAICISIGVAALERFSFLEFVFAAILIWAGIKTLLEDQEGEDNDIASGTLAKIVRRFIPIDDTYKGPHFFTIKDGKRMATPLFLSLILVEASDVIFAVDSIPAVLAVTKDPFLVYTSNIFAILGLRSLYFILSNLVTKFRYLGVGVSIILIFIGIKLAIARWYHLPITWALGFIVATLVISIIASKLSNKPDPV
jgi:tellurite resistance protein TerC